MYYHRTGVSEGIDINKASASEGCSICLYWVLMSMKLSDISILNIKSADYRCIINGISKEEAINLLKNVDLTE